jgi:hypothetical protein
VALVADKMSRYGDEMDDMHLRDPDDEFRERLLRGARIVPLLLLVPWLETFFRSFESVRFLIQIGAGVLAAIVAVRYYRRRMLVRVPTRFTESRSMPVRAIAKFVLGYAEVLVAFYAIVVVLGLFTVIDHFVQ